MKLKIWNYFIALVEKCAFWMWIGALYDFNDENSLWNLRVDGQDDPGKLKNRNYMPKKDKEKAKKDIIMESRQWFFDKREKKKKGE